MSDALNNMSADDLISSFGTVFTDPDEDDLKLIARIRNILEVLPPVEADFVDLYFFRHSKQTDIAAIFGVSQPTVCYRLHRAIKRIKYYLQIPHIDEAELRRVVGGFLTDPMDVDVMVYVYQTTCQSAAAKRLGVSQGLVRHRFMRSIELMAADPDGVYYADMFKLVAANLNILREVQRPVPRARKDRVLDT